MIENLTHQLSLQLQTVSVLSYFLVFLGGVLISFTPCIYPVAPITVAFIGARSSQSRVRGFILSAVYVLGMATTYTALGAFAALTGRLFGQLQSNPWVYFFMANVCIIMGLSMLDALSLPFAMPRWLSALQPRENKGGIMSSFWIGAASGLIIGPCTTPVLAVLLTYVAARQHVVYAMSLLFVFALGMGLILILMGTFAGLLSRVPKTGVWMVNVSHLFGWILIGTGEYFLIKAGTLWV